VALEIKLLGPLEVSADGYPLTFSRERERVLFALLAARSPGQITAGQLVEELWGETAPPGAQTTLRSYVSSLRRTLRARGHTGVIVTGRHGYAIAGDDRVIVDTSQFAELLAEARRLRAAGDRPGETAALRTALGLWRGRALEQLEAVSPMLPAAQALEDERLTALERWADCELHFGRHAELAAALAPICRAHPSHERLYAGWMRALYGSGRQAEALAAYRELYHRLGDELGLIPSAELRELELAILRHDPSLHPSAGARGGRSALPPALCPAPGSTFVGRANELRALTARAHLARAGSAQLITVCGEPGAGKTRLLADWAGRVRDEGFTVLYGRCDSDETIPYQPLVEALSRLGLPAVLAPAAPGSDGAPADADGLEIARWQWFGAVTELILGAAGRAPLMLVLDDLHWADASSLRLLRHVARRVSQAPVLIVVSYRSGARTGTGPLSEALAELASDPGLSEVELVGLSPLEVAELAGQSTLAGAGALAGELHRVTDGNPLFIRQMLSALELSGSAAPIGRFGDAPPAGVAEVIQGRLALLGTETLEVLTVAALLGEEFELRELETIEYARGPDASVAAIEAGLAGRVITPADGAPERYRFVHGLLRDGLRTRVAGPRRARLHQRIGDALEQLPDDDGRRLSALAGHFAAAARPGHVDRAAQYAERAGRHALSQLAFEQAAAFAGRGLDCLALESSAPSAARCDLLLLLAEARLLARDIGGCQEAAARAGEDARALPSATRLARAAIIGSQLNTFGQPSEATRRLCVDALAGIGDDDPVALAQVLAGFADYTATAEGDAPRAATLSARAVEVARTGGDHRALARALFVHAEALEWSPRLPERRALAEELGRLAIGFDDPQAATDAHHLSALVHLEAGNLAGFDADVARIDALHARTGYWYTEMFELLWRGMRALLAGRLDDVEAHADALLAYAGHEPNVVNLYMGQVLSLRQSQGRLAELRDPLIAVVQANPGIVAFRCVLVLVLAECGEHDRARDQLSRLAQDGFGLLARDSTWSTSLAVLSDAAVMLGDRRSAALLAELLRPHSGRVLIATKGIACLGAADRFRGELLAMCGCWEEADRCLRSAGALERRMGADLLLARTRRASRGLRRLRRSARPAHSALSSHQ
jgi:DNA-binding SARP family transcriptional activator